MAKGRMNMEKKEYSVIGKVEIGTDEYRDLIEAVKDAESRADRCHNDYWNEYRKAEALKKEVDSLKPFKDFVLEKYQDAFKLWKLERMENEDE